MTMKNNNYNIIMDSDSYKMSHFNQYPEGTEAVYSYFEAREGAKWDTVKFFGLQYLLKEYLVGVVVSQEMIDEAEVLAKAHFMGVEGTFHKEGWQYILDEHDGKLPVRIKAVPEGTVVPVSNVMMTVENTDPKCFWLTNFLETMLSRIWYPCTVATKSMEVRNIINHYWNITVSGVDPFMKNFCLHDFGSRGVSSYESAGVGGMAHLTNFKGTDTIHAMSFANKYYDADLSNIAYSVPATEHSVMTARGKDGEEEVFVKLLNDYPTGVLSVVSDSYDIYNFTTNLAAKYKEQILARDGKLVFRPDSGDPLEVTLRVLENLGQIFGYTSNDKGFKVLPPQIGVIWGDGIDIADINNILKHIGHNTWASSNIIFGMGGGLLQKVNRDTQRFAFKASAIKISGVWHDVYKDPVTAQKNSGMFKGSKRGKLGLYGNSAVGFTTRRADENKIVKCMDVLQTVFENGELVNECKWENIAS